MRYQKYYCNLSAYSLSLIKNQQFKINCIEDISIKSDAKEIKLELLIEKKLASKLMQRKQKIIRYQKYYCNLSGSSFPMSTKKQLRINYIQQISIKSDVKKIKYYQISKK